jgi:chromosome segregation ATPase
VLPQEGFRDLRRRLQIARLWAIRLYVRRSLSVAEAELGWLGWEQADYFDDQPNEAVAKVQEFENTQASLMNTTAEISARKAALDAEAAREKMAYEQERAALEEERKTVSAQLNEKETARRQKLDAVDRFERAAEEIGRLEKQLEARSHSFMLIDNPDADIRREAREASDELVRHGAEKRLVRADQAKAAEEAASHEPEIARLRGELQRIDAAAEAARVRHEEAGQKFGAELRELERERKESHTKIANLDRDKRKPYRIIGACLADQRIAPLNQPAALGKVLDLREREARLTETIGELGALCAAMDMGIFIAFYLLLGAVVFALSVVIWHFANY